MSAAIKGAIGGSIGGAAVIALLAWLYRRAWKKNGSQRATRQAQQPRQRRQESLNGDVTEHELDQIARMNGATGGVTREVGDEEDEDRPPKYARVGKPGEVPPVYGRSQFQANRCRISADFLFRSERSGQHFLHWTSIKYAEYRGAAALCCIRYYDCRANFSKRRTLERCEMIRLVQAQSINNV